jgi:Ca2+-binding EF-hand superfamily protein
VETGLKNLGRLFMLADNDQNGYLDEMEFNRFHRSVPLLAEAKFSDLDRDRDGKVFRAEYEAFLREALQVQSLLRGLGLHMALTAEGPELFRTLDANGDGKLSPREWQRAPTVLRNYDRNGDGVLEWNELVGHYDINIGLSDVLSGLAGVFPPGQQPRAPRPAMRPELRHNVPAWFRAMDRNGDGDISRREFPGTEAEFRQLDTDGDGLISLDEALAALQTLPTTQPPPPPHPHQPRR